MTIQPSPRMLAATDSAVGRLSDAVVLVARILIGWLFLTHGWAKFVNPQGGVKYFASLQIPYPEFWVWPSMVAEIGIGVALILGIGVRYVSLFTFVYLIIATALAHRYWEYPAAQQVNQYAHFCKNLAVMGGAALLYLLGGGRFSLDNWLRHR